MCPKFIEVHVRGLMTEAGEQAVGVNVGNIELISDGVIDTGKGIYKVTETYDEIKALIKDCGCLIHKGDPRLDMEHPLTMEDLQAMIGEPVWQSNLNVWFLVVDCDGFYVTLLWPSGKKSISDTGELIAYPLYRMKADSAEKGEK